MKTLTLSDRQYDELLGALAWAIDASETDMGEPDSDGPLVYQVLRDEIVELANSSSTSDGQFVTNERVTTGGGWLQGSVDTNYAALVRTFGSPSEKYDDYKSDAEWQIQFADGTYATVYNWKDGHHYLGNEGLDLEDITDWHVGGMSDRAVTLVKEALQQDAA